MLTRLTNRDVLDQIAKARRMAGDGVEEWKVRVPRHGDEPQMDVLCEARTVGDTVYLCPVSAKGAALVQMVAMLADKELEAMTLDDVQRELSASSADKVALGWPGSPVSCVCRVLALRAGAACTVLLFPGPIDMEKVNEEIKVYRLEHGCPTPTLDCEQCGRLVRGCDILEAAGEAARRKREKAQEG